MSNRPRISCDCGGEIQRPIPKTCPHCGAHITAVKTRVVGWLLPLFLILLMGIGLISFFLWWTAKS